MKKFLGDILVEKGYLNTRDLNTALNYQMRKVLGEEPSTTGTTAFLLDVARRKYNQRDEFYLGKILAELKMLPEDKLQEALRIQEASDSETPSDRMEALNRILLRINTSYNLIDLLHQIIVLAAELVGSECASLIVHDSRIDSLVILMPTGPLAEVVRETTIPRDQGIAAWVYENGRSAISNDVRTDSRFYSGIDHLSGYSSRQILCVPLTVKDKRLGAVEAINKRGGSGFTASDQTLLEMFSNQAAIAIENTRLTVSLEQVGEEAGTERLRAAAMVSRDLVDRMRKALIPFRGWTDRIRELSADPLLLKYASFLDEEMKDLVWRAEEVARFTRGKFPMRKVAVRLDSLLQDFDRMFWPDAKMRRIAVETRVEQDGALRADPQLLMSLVRRLFENSLEAMPEGGSFFIRAERLKDSVVFRIWDTGPGIRVQPMDRIFEPFFTQGKSHKAGLGLSIAQRIAEAHGGTLQAENRAGGGAQFTLTLPDS